MAQPPNATTLVRYPGGTSQHPRQSISSAHRSQAQGSCDLLLTPGTRRLTSKIASQYKSEPALIACDNDEDEEELIAVENDIAASEDYLSNALRQQQQQQHQSTVVVSGRSMLGQGEQGDQMPAVTTAENYAVSFPKLQASFV